MTDKELNKLGEWLNTQGYDIDLNDCLWMEDYIWNEHKTRDVIDLINDYHKEQLTLTDVVSSYFKNRLREERGQIKHKENECSKLL